MSSERADFIPAERGQNPAEVGPHHTCNGDPFECWAYCPSDCEDICMTECQGACGVL